MLTILSITALILAAIPAIVAAINLHTLRPPPPVARSPRPCKQSSSNGDRDIISDRAVPHAPNCVDPALPSVSILIPARNEESSIAAAVHAALKSSSVHLEVVVADDHSTDATAAIVEEISKADPRVRVISTAPLPGGWCGKQHACWVLAQHARYPFLIFIDADVRLAPDADHRLALHLQATQTDLLSGIPRQHTGTFLEKLLVPLIHVVLMGYLPIPWARRSRWSAFAAGCGQLFATTAAAYHRCDGHRSIRNTMHDGLLLPRTYRRAGLRTDLIDATDLAMCRMYNGASETWNGLGKNATEAMASPGAIVPWSILLLGGHVLPLVLVVVGMYYSHWLSVILSACAVVVQLFARWLLAHRFTHPPLSMWLHAFGVLLLMLIQYQALARKAIGKPVTWRDRQYTTPTPTTSRMQFQHP